MPQPDRVSRPDFNWPLIHFVHVRTPNNVGHNRENDLAFCVVLLSLPKQILQDWDLRQAGNAAQRLGSLIFHHSAENIGLSILQANVLLDFSLTDNRLADAADAGLAGHRRDVHRNLQRDLTAGMHVRRDVDVYPYVKVLKLRIDQRVNADAADSRLKRSSSNRHAVADLERRFLSIQRAYLGILD